MNRKTIEITTVHGDTGERQMYDRFRIDNFQVDVRGLYRVGQGYFIYCPGLSDDAFRQLGEYVKNNKPIGCWISLATNIPDNAIEIPERSIQEIAVRSGSTRNRFNLISDLHLYLQRLLTCYKIQVDHMHARIYHNEEITDELYGRLQVAIDKIGEPLRYHFIYVDDLNAVIEGKDNELEEDKYFGEILIGRFSTRNFSIAVRNGIDQDEEFWIDHQEAVFTKADLRKESLMPATWSGKASRCLIDINDGTKVQNILHLMCVYEKVVVLMPLREHVEAMFSALKIQRGEFIELVRQGKIQVIAPNHLQSYEKRFVEELVDAAVDNILFTRRLAAASVVDLRSRLPLLFPTISIRERKEVLKGLQTVANRAPNASISPFFKKLLGNLHEYWYMFPELIHARGALGTSHFGVASVLKDVLGLKGNQPLFLSSVSTLVEWASTINANVVSYPLLGLDLDAYFSVVSNVYSGIPKEENLPLNFDYANLAIERLLVVDCKISPVEFSAIFSHADVNRFRDQVMMIARNKGNREELDHAIKLFNSYVMEFDRNAKNKYDISGFVMDTVGGYLVNGTPLVSWFAGHFSRLLHHYGLQNKMTGEFLDSLQTDTLPNAVLVSRMRNQLAEKERQIRYR